MIYVKQVEATDKPSDRDEELNFKNGVNNHLEFFMEIKLLEQKFASQKRLLIVQKYKLSLKSANES